MKIFYIIILALSFFVTACEQEEKNDDEIVLCDTSFKAIFRRNIVGIKDYGVLRVILKDHRFETQDQSGEIEVLSNVNYDYIGKPVYLLFPKNDYIIKDIKINDYSYKLIKSSKIEGTKVIKAISDSEEILYSLDKVNNVTNVSYYYGNIIENYNVC